MWPIRHQARKQDVACGGRTHPGVALELHRNPQQHPITHPPPSNKQTNKPTTSGLRGTRRHFHSTARRLRHAVTLEMVTLFVDEDLIKIVFRSHTLKTIFFI